MPRSDETSRRPRRTAADASKRGNELLARASAPEGATLEFFQIEGRPSAAIHQKLEGNHYDLVVMGSHGARGFRRWFLGSVAEATLRHAPCSVLVVHQRSDGGDLREMTELRHSISAMLDFRNEIRSISTWPWGPGTLRNFLSALLLLLVVYLVQEVFSNVLSL